MVLHNKHKLFLFILFFISITTFSQKLEFDGGFILFREAKTKEPVLIINDSLLYKGMKPIKHTFRHTKYPEKLQEFIPFYINSKTYLVHSGCGPVLEFRNDSIVRINDAYLQRNQFGAVSFVYNNEIYFFGGYGLFTTKNILTKYIFKTKDWIEVQTHGEIAQEPRSNAYSYLKGDYLFVFGGGAKDEKDFINSKLSDNKVWRLHLPTMQWDCVGKYDQNLLKIGVRSIKSNMRKLYLQDNYFFEIDYYYNTLNIYNKNNFNGVLSSYMEGGKIIGVFKTSSLSFFHVGDISEFKGKLKSTTVFITPLETDKNYLATASVSFLVLILFFYLFRKQLMAIVKPFKGIVYNQRKQVFIYNRKPIILFDDQDKKILMYLIEHLNQYVSLNELNQLFENSSNSETFSATIKRREHAVNTLLFKVSKITGIDEKELIFVKKNVEDRRIKDVLLLPKLLKVYKK